MADHYEEQMAPDDYWRAIKAEMRYFRINLDYVLSREPRSARDIESALKEVRRARANLIDLMDEVLGVAEESQE